MIRTCRRLAPLAGLVLAGAASAQPATTPGAITTPAPTLRHLAVEWAIAGDSDGDGLVQVRYRPLGTGTWHAGMPLRRVPAGSGQGFSWGNRHSGSLFGLAPATTYEIELSLSDPDGGAATQIVTAATRAPPQPMAGAPVRPVAPETFAAVAATAQPGDILLFAPGTYAGFNFERDGAPGQPIVLRGMQGAVVEGELGLFFRHDVHIDGLTVNGRIRFNGSDRIAVMRCTVNASATAFNGDGIVSYLRAEDAYIADNTVVGTTPWQEAALGADGDNRGEGIAVTGPGHVIEHNRVRGFRDNISLLEDSGAVDQYGIDVLHNELSEAADDAIEADFCFHNCRIAGNRITNAFIAFSSQPGLGGPTYFIRNAAYNVAHVAFKLYRGSIGDVLLHNTVVKAGDGLGIYAGVPVARLYARNNFFLGGPGGTLNGYSNGVGRVMSIADLVIAGSSLDHDAYGATTGVFAGRFGPVTFAGVPQMQTLTSEAHGRQIDLSAFAQPVAFPSAPLVQHAPADLRLLADTQAVDMGQAIAGINDGYAGSAPDAGAYELGTALPHYGPRTDAIYADGFETP